MEKLQDKLLKEMDIEETSMILFHKLYYYNKGKIKYNEIDEVIGHYNNLIINLTNKYKNENIKR